MRMIVEILLGLGAIHLGIGCLFALWIQRSVLERMDPAVRGTGLGLRLILFPGLILLWPLLTWVWWGNRTRSNRAEAWVERMWPGRARRVHRYAWQALAVLVPIGLAMILGWRPTRSTVDPFPNGLPTVSVQQERP